jgi:hypothetical protein
MRSRGRTEQLGIQKWPPCGDALPSSYVAAIGLHFADAIAAPRRSL